QLDPLGHAAADAAAALDRFGVVPLEAAQADPDLGGAAEERDDLRVPQQRLGGDAAPVQAHAAGPVVLHDADGETELGAADRGDVAAGAGPDDRDVEFVA